MRAFLILGLLIACPSWAATTKTSMSVSVYVRAPGCVVSLHTRACAPTTDGTQAPVPTITEQYNPELGVMQQIFTF